MSNDNKAHDQVAVAIDLFDGLLGEIRAMRCALDTAETYCNKALGELRPLLDRPEVQKTTTVSDSAAPAPAAIVEDTELNTLTLPKRALETLAQQGVIRLSQLAKCRKGDLDGLAGLSPASRKAIYELLGEKGITLTEGRSYIEIVKLREACKEMASPTALKEHGRIIGYYPTSGEMDKWEFRDTPKFYFQAYEMIIVFLIRVGISHPERALKEKLEKAHLPTY